MAQELKELCQLLYPDSSTGNAEYFSDISEYIKDLGSQNWEYICKEPERLTEEMKQLTEQTQDLAFTNYKTFVESADVSRAIMKDLGKSKDSLSLFLDTMPSFVQECEIFSQMAGNIVKEKSRAGVRAGARGGGDEVAALLELPALMREALNAEDYESALDIYTFTRNLANRYADIPFIQAISSEIMTLWFETLYHLFNRLRYDLPLPQCLQILGYLRRANTVYKSTGETPPLPPPLPLAPASTSDGLHLHFLKARNAWFENALEEAKNNEAGAGASERERTVRRVVELHRVHLLNMVTQHKSIFLSDEEEQDGGGSALACWLQQKVEALTPLVEASVCGGECEEGAEGAEGAASQWQYLGAACARAGADPRAAIEPRLVRALHAALAARLRRAHRRLATRLARYTPPAPAPASALTAHGEDEPPGELVDWYPLAEFLNALLAALNALRGAAPLALALPAHAAYRDALRAGARAVAAWGAAGGAGGGAASMARLYAEAVVGHVSRCVSRAMPPAPLAEALGVPLSQLQDSRLLLLDAKDICQCFETIPHFTWS